MSYLLNKTPHCMETPPTMETIIVWRTFFHTMSMYCTYIYENVLIPTNHNYTSKVLNGSTNYCNCSSKYVYVVILVFWSCAIGKCSSIRMWGAWLCCMPAQYKMDKNGYVMKYIYRKKYAE